MTLDEKWVRDVARVIWRETYRHDTLLEFYEIKKGTLHYERTMAAARAVIGKLTITGSASKA